ncbi:MAG: glycosyltransferase family 4 protein [Pseudomonadota bacterium]
MQPANAQPLRILHVLRAPVGGLFRHVADLVSAQSEAGHSVGIVADSLTGGTRAAETLAALEPKLSLGLSRTPMPRVAGRADLTARRHVAERIAESQAQIAHGHGAKGGAYVRSIAANAGGQRFARLYTPHGGSLNYEPKSVSGRIFHTLERLLLPQTDAITFESAHAQNLFAQVIGPPPPASAVVVNGLLDADFAPLALRPDAADFVFIGELRFLKGVDVLLLAMARLKEGGLAPTLLIVGDGPDEEEYHEMVERMGLAAQVTFAGRRTAPYAFAGGACVLMPSRKESMPYVVLEAIAAARPIIASSVGGIPEILPDAELIAPGEVEALTEAMRAYLAAPQARLRAAEARRDDVRVRFSAARMAEEIETVYRAALP